MNSNMAEETIVTESELVSRLYIIFEHLNNPEISDLEHIFEVDKEIIIQVIQKMNDDGLLSFHPNFD